MSDKIKNAFSNEMSNSGALSRGSDAVMAANDMVRAISSTNEEEDNEQIIRKPFKKMKTDKLIGKKNMKKPIGKITMMRPIMGENEETNEKWSEKYKNSIDCNNPKGFSQKAHCQGKKKKTEPKEATGSGAAGGFESPLFSEPKRMDSMFKDEQPKKKVKGGFVYEESLKGGKADNLSIEDIAKKHVGKEKNESTRREKVDKMILQLKKQLTKGIKTEMEHTKSRSKAKEIAMDHLSETPNYYDKLKKVETKEATTSSSSGQYSTPKMWAKSTNKKDWRGASKPLIPGGKFVQVKKKCKKFPYCNQGDIKSLKIFENETVRKVITKVSKEHNISENVIKTILSYEYEKIKNNK